MSKETIVSSAFRVHRSKFSCSLAAALPGNGASWRAGAGRVRTVAFLSILRDVPLLF